MAEQQQGVARPAPRQTQTSLLLRALVAPALLALLVACGPGAAPYPIPTTATASPTSTPTPSPSPSDEPTPDSTPTPDDTDDDPNDRSELLEQPEAMENDDEEGAIAAAKYFMGLYEYVFLTGDLKMWEEMALPECKFCADVAGDVRELHEQGGHLVSESPEWLGKPTTRRVHSRVMWEVTLDVHVGATTTFDVDGEVIDETRGGAATVVLGMLYQEDAWRTMGVLVQTDG